jgi:hypothetical protein
VLKGKYLKQEIHNSSKNNKYMCRVETIFRWLSVVLSVQGCSHAS